MLIEHRVKFYTTPPYDVSYPYILANARKPCLNYISRYREDIKSVILDSGIEIFRNPEIKDYPKNHIYHLVNLYTNIKLILPKAEVFATVPDYCDDYHPKNLWLSEEITNIERTVENIVRYTKQFPHVNWLIPVQGWNSQPKSIVRCIEQLKEHGIVDKYSYFAIGNLCVEPNVRITYETIKIARKLLPDKKIHVFGLKLSALKYVMNFIDSFDSMAWTRPIDPKLGANWSCKNNEERKRFFFAWLKRLNRILSQKALL